MYTVYAEGWNFTWDGKEQFTRNWAISTRKIQGKCSIIVHGFDTAIIIILYYLESRNGACKEDYRITLRLERITLV